MFVVIIVEDTIKLHPSNFGNKIQTIEDEIEKKFTGKIILDVGLCIGLHDIQTIGDALVYPGDGSAHIHITFRLVVFRPFVGEVIEGKILFSTPQGIRVTIGFFDEILIAPDMLPIPSFFEEVWIWKYQDKHLMNMENGQAIRFRVESVQFNNVDPPLATIPDKVNKGKSDASTQIKEKEDAVLSRLSPMVISASVHESGFGMVAWWCKV